jgi:hypothetical protein
MLSLTKIERSRKISLMAVLTASAIASNYLLIGLLNVKFMDLIVFTGGFLFGGAFGASIGALTWLVYGTINPYGFNLPTLGATIIGETIYGIAGGLARNRLKIEEAWKPDFRLGVIGFLLTFLYDVLTNIVSAWVAGIPIVVAFITGIPFTLTHEVSNAVFFSVGVPPLVRAIRKLNGLNYE